MLLYTLDGSFPQPTEVGSMFRYETPLYVPESTEIRENSMRFALLQELVQLLQFLSGSNKVCAMVTPDESRESTASNKPTKGCQEGFHSKVRYKFHMNCFHCQRDKDACVCIEDGWLSHLSRLDEKETGIVYPNSLKHTTRSNTPHGQLTHHLQHRLGSLTSAGCALPGERPHRLPKLHNVVSLSK